MVKNIVFIETKLLVSTYKIARALKKTGKYNIILLCLSKANKIPHAEAFNEVINFDFKITLSFKGILKFIEFLFRKDAYRIYKKLKNINPYIVQVRGPSLEGVFLMSLFRKCPRVFYLQDIWSYYSKKISFEKDSGRMQFFNALSEGLSIKMADGILNRSGEGSLSYKKPKIKVPVLDFLPFCIKDWLMPIKKKKITKKEINLVYAGTVWDEWKGHASFPVMINKIIDQKIHLHLYPSNKLSDELRKKLQKIASENKFFHFYNKVDEDKINKEISKYDYALHLDFYDSSINPLWYITGMSGKIFGYIEAGLPIIINKQFRNMYNLIKNNNVGFGITYNGLSGLREKILSRKYPSKKDFLKARDKYDIDKNIYNLEKFYDRVNYLGNKRVNGIV